MKRGKPKTTPNDGVDPNEAPHGCIARQGNGCCEYVVDGVAISCCFYGTEKECLGSNIMNCTCNTRRDRKTVAYEGINK
jgi:hypothetical protein